MKKNIAFLIKTDINTDGRVLNELRILQNKFKDIHIDFIILPDKPVRVDLGDAVTVHEIHCSIRNSKWLKAITALEFTLKSLRLLFKLKPTIVHAQDSAIVFPVLLYRFFKRRKPTIIYDDHEIPNENRNLRGKTNGYFEDLLLKKSDAVIFANRERMTLIKERLKLQNRLSYFLNLPYFQSEKPLNQTLTATYENQLQKLDGEREEGIKFIIHQGPINEQRGRQLLAEFSLKLPSNYKILLLGGNCKDFKAFKKEYQLKDTSFYFIGTVDYDVLTEFWKRGTASVVMYLPKYINNKLCAPNRFYLSLEKQIPVIVNRDNPVLSNFVEDYNCGFYIDQFNRANFDQLDKFDRKQLGFAFQKIRVAQMGALEKVYKKYL